MYTTQDTDFEQHATKLEALIGDTFPFTMVMVLEVEQTEAIIAPSYRWHPEIPQEEHIVSVMQAYGVQPLKKI